MVVRWIFVFILILVGHHSAFGEDVAPEEALDIVQETQNMQSQHVNPGVIKKQGSFTQNTFVGGASYSYPIVVPAGRRGMTPEIQLNYDSLNKDMLGSVGYGWSLNLQSIYRSTEKGAASLYEANTFTALTNMGMHELVKINSETGLFMSKDGNHLTQYYFENDGWRAVDVQGNVYRFGIATNSRVIHPEDESKIFQWGLDSEEDVFGNRIQYEYVKPDNMLSLVSIEYAFTDNQPLYRVAFDYTSKTRSASKRNAHFEMQNFQKLSAIRSQLKSGNQWQDIKTYSIEYDNDDRVICHLSSIHESAGETSLPITTFDYGEAGTNKDLLISIDNGQGGLIELDYLPSTAYKVHGKLATKLPFVTKTLHSVREYDAVTGVEGTTTYDYEGGSYYFDQQDVFGREYAGFHLVTKTDAQGNVTRTYHHQNQTQDNSQHELMGEQDDHISKKGRVYRQEIFSASGSLYQSQIIHWNHVELGSNRWQVLKDQEVILEWDGDDSARASAISHEYDSFGNPLVQHQYGLVNANRNTGEFTDVGNDLRTLHISYANDTSKNLIGFPARHVLKNATDNNVSQVEYRYDGDLTAR